MKSQITIYHSKDLMWLNKILTEHYGKILEEVETAVRAKRIGLPWKQKDLDGDGNLSWELNTGFEVSLSVARTEVREDEQNLPKACGTAWTLRDFWMAKQPPCRVAWNLVPDDAKDALLEWFNVVDPSDEDLVRLADLHINGQFVFGSCGYCGTDYRRGTPNDWGHFQGVHNDDEGVGCLCAECYGKYLSLQAFVE